MTILVTGATGFIGAHLAKYLLDKGNDIISIRHDDKPITTSKLIGIENKIIWANGSILDCDFIKRIVADYEIDKIFHAAALPIVRVGTRTTLPIFQTNVIGTCNVLEAAKEQHLSGYDVSMLFISTDKVYGNVGEIPYNEGMRLNALGIYDSSKAAADIICRSYNYNYELKVVVARCCNIVGIADLNSRIIPNTVKRCIKGENPIIYNGIPYVREYIHISDACKAYELLMDNIEKTKGDAFNIGSGHHFNQEGVIKRILVHFPNLKAEYKDPPFYTKIEIPYQMMDATKIYNTFGWKAVVDFDFIIEEVIDWWKNKWGEREKYGNLFK